MKSIYVGNLAYEITQQQLHDLFAQFGEVLSSRLIMDKETKRFKGYAFVEMEDENALTAIEKLNGTTYLKRVMRVNEAKENKAHTN